MGEGLESKTAWPGFEKFSTVQDILDHNKILINEINANHESRLPEALARNVLLIRELNNNVAKVVELYKELSESFMQLGQEMPTQNDQQQ
ncbi:hypothetical protein WJX72_011668 [[Myrmecia] bisecta]|uniref:Protein EARLY FLOWERING 4 domain-containing protein n=1 Tax=[Myrmecia] bisecta TaxID=41462 RepID=A0AAW1QTL6_9CHLO